MPLKPRSKVGPSVPLGAMVFTLPSPNYGKPSLLNFYEVEGLIKEFGKLLQFILSENEYSDTAGIQGMEKDTIDFVSFFIVEWLYHPDVLKLLSEHWMTKKPLDDDIIDHLCTSIKHHMNGYRLCYQLYKSEFDLVFYGDETDSWDTYEDSIRKNYLLLPKLNFDKAPLYFTEMMAGTEAAATYCSIWAKMLGMVSHKISVTIFGHKHFGQKF